MAVNADLHLWRAVLVLGLHDAAKGAPPQDAAWIGSTDFHMVCALAQVEPDAVLRSFAPGRFERRPTIAA